MRRSRLRLPDPGTCESAPMIGFFPEPLPDELFFSICSRYAEMLAYPTKRTARYDLFKSKRTVVSVDFPIKLETLINVLPPGHFLTTDRFINDHTLLPLFIPFVPAKRVSTIKKQMRKDGANVHGSLGVNTFSGKVKVFRYCPACIQEDRDAHGETYWHRSHHIPGINVCATHKNYLKNSEVPLRYSAMRAAFVTAETTLQRADMTAVYEHDDRLLALQTSLANNATWLLQQPIFAGYETNHRNHYVHLLYERGYCTYSGVLDRRKLANDLTAHYSSSLLRAINCDVVYDGSEDWLNRLAHRRDRLIHPLHHLLLLQFLEQTPESFLSATDRWTPKSNSRKAATKQKPQTVAPFINAPFGPGPWPCLNSVSSHFQQNVVTVCEITATQLNPRRPRGTFRCECGFAYSRVGPDQGPDDRNRIDRYVTFGECWEDALRDGLARGDSYRTISRRLRVTCPIMLKQMFRLGLKTAAGRTIIPWNIKHSRSRPQLRDRRRLSSARQNQKRLTTRQEWLELRQANPTLGRTKIREAGNTLYVWLYKYDRDWLEKHMPEHRSAAPLKTSIWRERDAGLAAAVRVEAEKIRARPGRPVRISATAIADTLEITQTWIKRPAVLPLTCKALEEIGENLDQFAVRRIEWATAHFQKQGLAPAAWRIAVFAGVGTPTAKRPVVKAALAAAVGSLKAQTEDAWKTR